MAGAWEVENTTREGREPLALTIGCDPDPVVSGYRTVSGADDIVNVLTTEMGDVALTTTVQASVDALARRDAKYTLDLVTDTDRQLLWNAQHAWAMAEPLPHVGTAAVRVTPGHTVPLLALEPFDYVRVRIPPEAIDQTLRVVGMRWYMDHEGVDLALTFMGEPPDAAPALVHATSEAGGSGGIGGDIGSGGGGVPVDPVPLVGGRVAAGAATTTGAATATQVAFPDGRFVAGKPIFVTCTAYQEVDGAPGGVTFLLWQGPHPGGFGVRAVLNDTTWYNVPFHWIAVQPD
jgi:hypothetical protein